MSAKIERVSIRNYRALADVCFDLGDVTVIFGPNGAGKSSILDTIWFFRAFHRADATPGERNRAPCIIRCPAFRVMATARLVFLTRFRAWSRSLEPLDW